MKKVLLFALLALGLAACSSTTAVPLAAQQGGGLTAPQLQTVGGPNTVVDSSTALTVLITTACNAQAQVDYGWLVQLCGGSITLPTLPVSITTNIGTQIAQEGQKAWCQANLWTGPSGQLIVPIDPASKNPVIPALGNCPTFTAPAPVPAPAGTTQAAAPKG